MKIAFPVTVELLRDSMIASAVLSGGALAQAPAPAGPAASAERAWIELLLVSSFS